jgi:hypothetical protein
LSSDEVRMVLANRVERRHKEALLIAARAAIAAPDREIVIEVKARTPA